MAGAEAAGMPDAGGGDPELTHLRQENALLKREVERLKSTLRGVVAAAETSEERMVNKLLVQLEELQGEKQVLQEQGAVQAITAASLERDLGIIKSRTEKVEQELEAEQEFLVHKLMKRSQAAEAARDAADEACKAAEAERGRLQAKLTAVRADKVALEVRLEAEQEYITLRLQRQLAGVRAEKEALESTQHTEVAALLAAIQDAVQRLGPGTATHEGVVTPEAVLGRLDRQLTALQARFAAKAAAHGHAAEASAASRAEVARLRQDNWLLRQRVAAVEDTMAERMGAVAAHTVAEELSSERAFNSAGADGVVTRGHLGGATTLPRPPRTRHSRSHSHDGFGLGMDAAAARASAWTAALGGDGATDTEEEDERILGGRGNSVFPPSLAGSAPSPAPAASPPLPPGPSAPLPPLPGLAPGEWEGGAASTHRWRRSLGVDEEWPPSAPGSDAASSRGGAFNSGGGVPFDLASLGAGTPPLGGAGGDTASVTGSVSGMSSVSESDRASAALVESGVEAIKAALRREGQE